MDRSTAQRGDRRETTTGRTPSAIAAELRRRNPILCAVAAVHAVLFVAFAAGVVADPRTLGGEPIWLKPAKFAGSIALVSATLAWLGVHLPVADRFRRRASLVIGGGFLIEIALIGGQAARGVGSHFNRSTALDTAVGAVMGVTIVIVTLTIGWLAIRSRGREFAVHPAFATGITLGIGLFVVGAFEGGAMIALQSNGVRAAGPTVPVLGWHLIGDFRLAHFVGLHALQVVPGAGYAAATTGDRLGIDRPVRLVGVVALGHAVVLCLAFVLAMLPLLG
jgi:hypothetical protein